MIHAIIADSRGHKTTANFTSPSALATWRAVQARQHRGMTIAAASLNETPSLYELEARAREYVVHISRSPKGFRWQSAHDDGGWFETRPQALRDAFECGELGE
jgi:hypothetical protein